jgi:hypothetical protein
MSANRGTLDARVQRLQLNTSFNPLGRSSGLPELLTPDEVCRYLGISRRTLWRRNYPYTKEVGSNRRRYYAEDIKLALQLNIQTPR